VISDIVLQMSFAVVVRRSRVRTH